MFFGVGKRQVLGSEFTGGVGPPRLSNGTNGIDIFLRTFMNERSIHLARGEVDEALDLTVEGRLEDSMSAEEVHLHGRNGILDNRVHAGDRGAVDHNVCSPDGLAYSCRIQDVA